MILASIPGQFRNEFEHYLFFGSASLLLNFSRWSFGGLTLKQGLTILRKL